jgi:hypothetical protein
MESPQDGPHETEQRSVQHIFINPAAVLVIGVVLFVTLVFMFR